ncbi:MAG: SDR family oxidoreductase [Acidimicrobiia bacterium]|nr:SDR family oxidoreductase [Acidimicrobiia bacterium]
MNTGLDRRVALVTGGGRGIGRGIATALAAEGAAVAVNDLHRDRADEVASEIVAAGGRAASAIADVTDLAAVRAMVSDAETTLGPIDVLVNNAGVPETFALQRFRDMPVEDWDKFIQLNLYGVINCIHAVVDGMCDRGWGRIVTISSEAGRIGVGFGISLYGAAKAGAVGFSHHLATELIGTGVTVNCLSLGLMAASADDVRRPPPPTVRLGRPEDVAGAVCYLASDAAEWITGQTLPVNGGHTTS